MPTQAVEIQSLDDFLLHLGRVRNGDATWENISFLPASVVVPVRAKGVGLDKRVDARSAAFIQNVQQRADDLYAKYSPDGEDKAPLIKVEARDGSNLLDFDLTGVLLRAIDRLPPEAVTVIASLVTVGALGLSGFWLWTRHKENMANAELVKKALEINENVAREALGSLSQVASPIRSYANSLGNETLMSVAGSPPIPADEAKKALAAKRPRLPVYVIGSDGVYELLGLGVEKSPPTLRISQNGATPVVASIRNLGNDVQNFLVDKVKSCLADGSLPQSIQLQLDVFFNEKERKSVNIMGVGEPRPDMNRYKLDDIPWHVDLNDATLL